MGYYRNPQPQQNSFVRTNGPLQNKISTNQPRSNNKAFSIISFIASLPPIYVLTECFIGSGGSFSEDGAGSVWWFAVIYYMSIGIPLLIVSLVFGFLGLKTKLRWLAIVSLCIKFSTIGAVLIVPRFL